jgi:hypothetical protein
MTFSGHLRRHNAICNVSQASCADIDQPMTYRDHGSAPQRRKKLRLSGSSLNWGGRKGNAGKSGNKKATPSSNVDQLRIG